MKVESRHIEQKDAGPLYAAFAGTPWGRRGLEFYRLLASQHPRNSRVVWVGLADDRPVGFGSLVWRSDYPPFARDQIPEVQDLNVAPAFRRRGIASSILDRAEHTAFAVGNRVGVGFGLHPGYRAAQRLYVLRGYVPDGNGLFCDGRFPKEGERVVLDDTLVLYLVKSRPPGHAA